MFWSVLGIILNTLADIVIIAYIVFWFFIIRYKCELLSNPPSKNDKSKYRDYEFFISRYGIIFMRIINISLIAIVILVIVFHFIK
jgi:hypothetical protein